LRKIKQYKNHCSSDEIGKLKIELKISIGLLYKTQKTLQKQQHKPNSQTFTQTIRKNHQQQMIIVDVQQQIWHKSKENLKMSKKNVDLYYKPLVYAILFSKI
jgi:hypothetical protein